MTDPACPPLDRLDEYRNGGLTAAQAAVVEAHLAGCERCSRVLDELDTDQALVRELRDLLPEGPERSDPESPLSEVEELGAHAARFERLHELGRGGMSRVHLVHDRLLDRRLALKEPLEEAARFESGGRRTARFLEEARLTARLDHPGIVTAHDLGVDAAGRPFFTMPVVEGQGLDELLDRHFAGEVGLPRVVRVLQMVCETIAYAHSKGVVHRDLKPANIRVGRFGEVFVIDWGIARVLDEDSRLEVPTDGDWGTQRGPAAGASPMLTRQGEVVGTPVYMAPEQVRGRREQLGPAVDVYAVGAMLYQVVAGHPPYAEPESNASDAGAFLARLERTSPKALRSAARPGLPVELLSIAEKAMARDPRARYASIKRLADDLGAFIDGRVVGAHSTGLLRRGMKWVGRNRVLASVLLGAGLVIAGISMRSNVVQARERAAKERVSRRARVYAIDSLIERDPGVALDYALEVASEREDLFSRSAVLDALASFHEVSYSFGYPYIAWSPDERRAVLLRGSVDALEVRDATLTTVLASVEISEVTAQIGLEWAGGGETIVLLLGMPGRLLLFDIASGRLRELRAEGRARAHEGLAEGLDVSPDGQVVASAGQDGWLRIWDVETGSVLHSIEVGESLHSVAFSPDGSRCITSSRITRGELPDGFVRLWDVDSGSHLREVAYHAGGASAARFGPDGSWIVSVGEDSRVLISSTLESRSLAEWSLPGGETKCIDLDSRGTRLAVGFDAGLALIDRVTGCLDVVQGFDAHEGRQVVDVRFDPAGRQLLSVGSDSALRRWRVTAEGLIGEGRSVEPSRELHCPLSWTAGGTRLCYAASAGAFVWSRDPVAVPAIVGGAGACRVATFDSSGARLLLSFESGPARLMGFEPLKGLESLAELGAAGGHILDAEFDAGGDEVWLLDEEGLAIWSTRQPHGGRELARFPLAGRRLALAPRSGLAAVGLKGGGLVLVRSSADSREVLHLDVEDEVESFEFDATSSQLALGTTSGQLLVFDTERGQRIFEAWLEPETARQRAVFGVDFDRSGRVLAGGPSTHFSRFDVDQPEAHWVSDPCKVASLGRVVSLGNGSRALCVGHWQGRLALYDVARDRSTPLRDTEGFDAHSNRISSVSLSASHHRALTTSFDGRARIWDLEHGSPIVTFGAHEAAVTVGDLRAEGDWAVTGDAGGVVRVWPVDPLVVARAVLPEGFRERTVERRRRLGLQHVER